MRPPSKRDGPPEWFDHTSEKECDHDKGSLRVKREGPYRMNECNVCGETWCVLTEDPHGD